MTRRAYLLLALLALPFGIAAQAPKNATPSEPALEIILPADSARAKEAPVVRSVRMLSDRTTRELLFSGFPARLHFRLELWKANRFFDDLVRTIEWDVVVSYDPLARHYTVTRIAGPLAVAGHVRRSQGRGGCGSAPVRARHPAAHRALEALLLRVAGPRDALGARH